MKPEHSFQPQRRVMPLKVDQNLPEKILLTTTVEHWNVRDELEIENKNLKMKKFADLDVTRTRSLLIWSQTRYHCATKS